MKNDAINVPKHAETRKDGVIIPQMYSCNSFWTRKNLMLSKRYKSTEIDKNFFIFRTWLNVPRGLPGQHAVPLTKWLKYEWKLLPKCINHF